MPDHRGLRAVAILMAASFVAAQTGPWGSGAWLSLLVWCAVVVLPFVGAARFVIDVNRALHHLARRRAP